MPIPGFTARTERKTGPGFEHAWKPDLAIDQIVPYASEDPRRKEVRQCQSCSLAEPPAARARHARLPEARSMRPDGRFFVPQKPKETLLILQAVSLEDLGWDAF